MKHYIHEFAWQMKKNEFGFAVTDSPRPSCKIWALAHYCEALLIRYPDHGNTKQILNTMILYRETQNKKIMCYLNKQNFCVSYLDVGRQSKKWKNEWR